MATVILNHRVKDFKTWKVGYDSDKDRREAIGVRELAVGQHAQDPGNVYIVLSIEDPSALSSMFSDPKLQKSMEEAGVIGAPEMIVLN